MYFTWESMSGSVKTWKDFENHKDGMEWNDVNHMNGIIGRV